jgi:Kef-type K+ transport system membrane component KefB
MRPVSTLFVPPCFVLMRIGVHPESLAGPPTLLRGALLILRDAAPGKLPCALGAFGGGLNRLAIGIGMVPPGAVGLLFAGIGTGLTLEGEAGADPGDLPGHRPDGAGHGPDPARRAGLGLRQPARG